MAMRDTTKYHFKRVNKILHTGITNDPERREQEYKSDIDPKGHLQKVGRQTTRDRALEWESLMREKGKPTGP